MSDALHALFKALASLLRWKILIRVVLPFILAFSLCVFLGVVFWNYGTNLIERLLLSVAWFTQWMEFVFSWTDIPVIQLISFLSVVFFILILIPFTYFITLILASLLLVPLLQSTVIKMDFPTLQAKNEGSFFVSLRNSLVATLVFGFGFILGLPLFLVPGGQLLWPLFLNAYVAQKVFPYDALQDFATEAEVDDLLKNESHSFWALGLIASFLFYIPFVNLLSPSLIALSYIYLSLNLLQKKRQQTVSNNKVGLT